MTTAQQRKGSAFERLVVDYLRSELGRHLTRQRAGGIWDRGDIGGVPGWTIEVKCYGDMLLAIRRGLVALEAEQALNDTPHGLLVVKRVGVTEPSKQLAVMTLGNVVPLMRETVR